MKLLLKQVTIAETSSPYNGLIKDILIDGGFITSIEDNIDAGEARIIEQRNVFASPGWVDIFAHFNDPGFEFKETIATGKDAAAAGGYTDVFVLPNTNPTLSTKSSIEYVLQKAQNAIVNIFPIGSVSKQVEGKELAEMYDMRNSGATAFSDGIYPVQSSALLLKALQYVKAFNGMIIQMPVDTSISKTGLMNESITSTQMGLPGIPSIAEELMIARDIELAKYTGSRLHITGVSTAKGLHAIKQAKAEGVMVSCSVTPYHLFYNDEDMVHYNTNLKVDPPLRNKADMMALREGLMDGTIDCIASHHLPQNWDNKVCEFEYAKPGMIGLQTAFNVVNTACKDISLNRLVDLFSSNARKLFGLPENKLEKGKAASITLFTRDGVQTLNTGNNKSRSANSPFLGEALNGKVIGIINKDQLYLNA